MAISRITSQDATNTSATTSVSVNYPGATTAGNMLIAVVGAASTINMAAPSGFTQLGGTFTWNGTASRGGLFYKVAVGSETSISSTCSGATAMTIDVFEYNKGGSNPVVVDVTLAGTTATGTSLAASSITTTYPVDLILYICGTNGNVTNPAWTTSTVIGSNISGGAASIFCGELITANTKSSFVNTASWTTSLAAGVARAAIKADPNPGLFENYKFVKAGDGISVTEKIR